MAIDYKKEWSRLNSRHGLHRVTINNKQVHLRQIMTNQINNTIAARENLMKEYIKENMMTDIGAVGAETYAVEISLHGCPIGTIYVGRINFDTWLKERKKGGK